MYDFMELTEEHVLKREVTKYTILIMLRGRRLSWNSDTVKFDT